MRLNSPTISCFRGRRIAFTLVELLVVIGIIAALIAILLPVLSKARRLANQVKCLSNLHQLGMAAQMHANEHHGRVPLAGYIGVPDYTTLYQFVCYYASGPRPAPWPAALSSYLNMGIVCDTYSNVATQMADPKLMKLFICPSQITDLLVPTSSMTSYYPSTGITQWSWGYAPAIYTSYGFNESITGVNQTPGVNAATHARLMGLASKIKHASTTALYFDALGRTGTGGSFATQYQYYDASNTSASVGSRYGTMAESLLDTANPFRATVFDYTRHDKKINVVFLDGHASTVNIAAGDLATVSLSPFNN